MKRTYLKSELAQLADVSYSTFYRYLVSRRNVLASLGCGIRDHGFWGEALEYICTDYNIHLPDEEPETVHKHIKIR